MTRCCPRWTTRRATRTPSDGVPQSTTQARRRQVQERAPASLHVGSPPEGGPEVGAQHAHPSERLEGWRRPPQGPPEEALTDSARGEIPAKAHSQRWENRTCPIPPTWAYWAGWLAEWYKTSRNPH